MATVTVTRNSQITIPKEIRRRLGIKEGDRVRLRVEADRILVEKVSEDVWADCTDFLPDNFEKVLSRLRKDSTSRLKRLGIAP